MGQIWQIKNELKELCIKVRGFYLTEAAISFVCVGDFDEAITITNNINSDYEGACYLNRIAGKLCEVNQIEKATILLNRAIAITDTTTNKAKNPHNPEQSYGRSSALYAIANTFSRIAKVTKNDTLIELALKMVKFPREYSQSRLETFGVIVEALLEMERTDKTINFFNQIIADADSPFIPFYSKLSLSETIVNAFGDNTRYTKDSTNVEKDIIFMNEINTGFFKARLIGKIAATLIEMNQTEKALNLLNQALAFANDTTNLNLSDRMHPFPRIIILREIASRFGEMNQIEIADSLINQAMIAVNRLKVESQAEVLIEIANTVAKMKQTDKAQVLLNQAIKIATDTTTFYPFNSTNYVYDPYSHSSDYIGPDYRGDILSNIVSTLADMGQSNKLIDLVDRIIKIIEQINDERYAEYNARILHPITKKLAEKTRSTKDTTFIDLAIKLANLCAPSYRVRILSMIAATLADIKEEDRAVNLVNQCLSLLRYENEESESFVLSEIAATFAKLGNWKEARDISTICSTDNGKTMVLCSILKIWSSSDSKLIK